VLAGKAVDKARDKIERSAGDIAAVIKEEKIEKELRQAEMHAQKVPPPATSRPLPHSETAAPCIRALR
jgi:hypothetical protein